MVLLRGNMYHEGTLKTPEPSVSHMKKIPHPICNCVGHFSHAILQNLVQVLLCKRDSPSLLLSFF